MKLFTLFYFTLATLIYLIALPFLLLFALKKKYKQSIPARFFLYKNRPFNNHDIWFHACSLGEVRALSPIIELFKDEKIAVSTTTATGYSQALKLNVQSRYLPFEIFLPFWIKKSKVVVVLEAEFWYLLFSVVKARGGHLILLNARISTKSYPKYQKMGWFYKKLFNYVDMVFVQSPEDKERFISLGVQSAEVVGNIKLAQEVSHTKEYEKSSIETLVAASTHESEEVLIFNAFKVYRASYTSKLIVVPRHPERFDAVWTLIQKEFKGLKLARWSEAIDFNVDVLLVDTMDELNNIYRISDIAILGGAFKEDVGGHNPLEPAHFGCKILSGEHYFNQRELFKYVENLVITKNSDLSDTLLKMQAQKKCFVDEEINLERVKNYINKELEKR